MASVSNWGGRRKKETAQAGSGGYARKAGRPPTRFLPSGWGAEHVPRHQAHRRLMNGEEPLIRPGRGLS